MLFFVCQGPMTRQSLTSSAIAPISSARSSKRLTRTNTTRYTLRYQPLCDKSLLWRHDGHDGVWNHQPHHCLRNRLFERRSKKTSKLRVTGLCAGNSPGTGEFPAQMASNADNVSIWWRHHEDVAAFSVIFFLNQMDRVVTILLHGRLGTFYLAWLTSSSRDINLILSDCSGFRTKGVWGKDACKKSY